MRDPGPVRPSFELSERPPKKTERIIAGTKNHGMVVDISEIGIEINGYYTGFVDPDKKYAILRQPVAIPWEELSKVRALLNRPAKCKTAELDRVEDDVSEEYLATLSKVKINGGWYYIDTEKRERRSVEKPTEVWRF
jgi:hypothetical protein